MCYGYDVQDNLTSVTDPNGNQTSYTYDDFRRMQSQVSPVSNTTKYSYDAAGNLTKSVDARQLLNPSTDGTMRTYDSANRILSATAVLTGQPTEIVTWTYDEEAPLPCNPPCRIRYAKGRLTSMTEPSGSSTFAYERRGLLRSEAKTIGLTTYTLSYGYDPNGNRSSIRYPSGRLVSYTFDFADRPLTACSGGTGPTCTGPGGISYASAAGYQPFGPESGLTYGTTPTVTRTMSYDQRYRPTELKLQGASTIYDYFYNEDAVGNITSICASSGACPTPSAAYDRVFGYDDLNRLTTAKSGSSLWGSASGNGYAYDSMGNMTSATLGSTTRTFTYVQSSGHQTPKLASVVESGNSRAVLYDPAGNEASVTLPSSTFTYSSRNYLASGDNLSYIYDGRGLRLATTRTGVNLFPVSLTVDPMSVQGGTSTTGRVTLNDTTGGTVTLTSSDPNVTVPTTVMVSASSSFATFAINSTAVASDRKVVITATLNGVAVTAVLTVTQNVQLLLVSLSPRTVHGGGPVMVTGTAVLNGPAAPSGGAVVTLMSSNTSVATVPGSVTVLQNQTTAQFTVTTLGVTSTKAVDISGSYGGVTFHAALTVTNLTVEWQAPRGELLLASLGTWRPERGAFALFADSRWEAGSAWPGLVWAFAAGQPASDESGLRVEVASVPGPPTRNFIYSPEMNLLAESELSYPREKRILYEYIWFNGHPVAQVDGTAVTHWTFTDHLGTPLIQTDTAGAVWWRAEYEPYGKVYAFNPPGLADQHQPLRLPGQEAEQLNLGMNGATERSYNTFRWYRPAWGRYSQADPAGMSLGSSTNLFAYVDDRPTIATDPLGLVSGAAECAQCCPPEQMQEELNRSWRWTLGEQKRYTWGIGAVCRGESCGTSADRLRRDLEQNVAPKCWITSTQLTSTRFSRAFNRFIGRPVGLTSPVSYGIVHFVVKYSPCNRLGPNYYFDSYLTIHHGPLNPIDEIP